MFSDYVTRKRANTVVKWILGFWVLVFLIGLFYAQDRVVGAWGVGLCIAAVTAMVFWGPVLYVLSLSGFGPCQECGAACIGNVCPQCGAEVQLADNSAQAESD